MSASLTVAQPGACLITRGELMRDDAEQSLLGIGVQAPDSD
ncbi:hypothetical protein [Streptomyces sp. GS7]|nr:hypothetical protein [Streptomyces sp. GS7]